MEIFTIGGCRSPTTASAKFNPIGSAEYVYSLPPITLSNSNVQQAFIPNIFLCFDPNNSEYNDSVFLYTLTGNSSRNSFSYGLRTLTYNSTTLDWRLADFQIVTIYGFNVSTNSLGNYINWSSESGAIIVDVINYGRLSDNNANFTDGNYDVTADFVTYELYNEYGQINVRIPYTSYSTATTNYSGTFNPTRIVGTSPGYQEGYDIGFSEGDYAGYIRGYEEGINESLGEISPFSVVVDFVGELFNMPIFGYDITLFTLMKIGFGMILVGLIIKLFLGG